jgi:hypothetical protein
VRDAVHRVAGEFGRSVLIFAHPAQAVDRGTVIRAEGPDAADFALFSACRRGDIVVTDDLGLAALVLSRGAAALSSRGRRYAPASMRSLLHQRHLARKARRAGKRTGGPSAMRAADHARFARRLREMLAQEGGPPPEAHGA